LVTTPAPPETTTRTDEAAIDAAVHLRRVQSLTDATLARLDLDELLDTLLERARHLLGADTAAVLLLDETTRELVATAAKGIEEEVRQGVRIPMDRGFAGRVAADGQPIVLNQVDHTTVLNPILVERGIRSLLGIPLVAQGRTIGVLHVGRLGSRPFTGEDAELLQLAADRAAWALSASISREERIAARTLQRSLAPPRLPHIAGVELAARYVPGRRGAVGGDWFDLFVVPNGGVAIAIGDVAGHGLNAAVVMGRLRSALRAYALEHDDPADVLEHLDALVSHFEADTIATVLFGVLDAHLERLTFAVAGHPRPLLAAPDLPATSIPAAVDPPVGIGVSSSRSQTTVELPRGATLYLYTDGLVERPGEDIQQGLERLHAAAICGPPAAGCARIMSALVGNTEPRDDVALLALRTTA